MSDDETTRRDHEPGESADSFGSRDTVSMASFTKGMEFGRYRIVHRIGSGGMGTVYSAFDPTLDRTVALKVLHDKVESADAEQRLLREAQAMARLSHPNVVTVHDAGLKEGRPYVAMELIEGHDLRTWLRREKRGWREIIDKFVAAGNGLAAAHAAGLVHRDFKPGNVMVGDDGRVRVTDFGLARAAEAGDCETTGNIARGPRDAGGRRRIFLAAGNAADPSRHGAGHAGLHGPGAGSRRPRRSSLRPVRLLRFAVRRPLRQASSGRVFESPGIRRPARDRRCQPAGGGPPGSRPHRGRHHERFESIPGGTLSGHGRSPRHPAPRSGATTEAVARRRVPALRLQRSSSVSSATPPIEDSCVGRERIAGRGGLERRSSAPSSRNTSSASPKASGAKRLRPWHRALDDYTDRWATVHREACVATRIRGEHSEALLDRQMACLRRRLRETDHLLALLAAGGREHRDLRPRRRRRSRWARGLRRFDGPGGTPAPAGRRNDPRRPHRARGPARGGQRRKAGRRLRDRPGAGSPNWPRRRVSWATRRRSPRS